jgi:hypothetical protein
VNTPAEISGSCALAAVSIGGPGAAEQLTIDALGQLRCASSSTLEVADGLDNAGLFTLIGANTTVTIGGTLTNSGSISIGVASNSFAPDTVTAAGLVNTSTGSIVLQGESSSGATIQVTLDITTASSSTIDGTFSILGDADLELPTGVTTVASDGTLQIEGAEARVSLGSGTTDTALANLSDNAGVVDLEGNTANGFGGVTLSTSVAFTNESGATFKVDSAAGAGGSGISIGGVFTNVGTLVIGNSTLGSLGSGGNTIVQIEALQNVGSIQILGNAASGATNVAALEIGAFGSSIWEGSLQVGGDAALLFFGNNRIRMIDSGASIELDGAEARVLRENFKGFVSALSHLTANHGTLTLRGDSSFGAGGATLKTAAPFTNGANANFSVDASAGDGGSRVTFGGTLTNRGTLDIGNAGLSALTKVTAQGLVNDETIALAGSSSSLAELVVNGNATTSGDMDIGLGSKLIVTGSNSFTEAGGLTTVEGRLVASAIDADAGKLDFKSAVTSGDGVGALDIGTLGSLAGTLEFDSSVDSSHTVDFASSAGTLALGDAHAFAGTINGFANSNVIDLLGQTVASLNFSPGGPGGILTATLSGGKSETLTFGGNYVTSDFAFGSDGHHGTAITFV